MFSARAYSFRQKSRLAVSLTWVAGYTNVIILMVCGTVVSHMTGNITLLGRSLSQGAGEGVLAFGSLWLCFLLGAAASAVMTETARRRGRGSKYVLPLAVEAMLLLVVLLGIRHGYPISDSHVRTRALIAGLAATAMGLQNATITKISGAVVRTTHVTGVTTDLGIEGVQYLLWLRDRLTRRPGWARASRMFHVSRRHAEFQRVALLATICGSFLLGAAAGTAVFLWQPGFALAPPVAFLWWLVYADWRTPIADLREIDVLTDDELRLHGIVQSLLPPDLGIWRVSCTRNGKWHKAPDFEHWVEIMPKRWRTIILCLNPLTRLDGNALMNLNAARQRLRDQGRHLVIAGVTPTHYRTIARSKAGRFAEPEDLCPDLEFAIARGIELVRPHQHAG